MVKCVNGFVQQVAVLVLCPLVVAQFLFKVLAYLTSRIEAATQFANESAIRGETAAAMGALETRNLFRSQAELLRTQGANAVGTTIFPSVDGVRPSIPSPF